MGRNRAVSSGEALALSRSVHISITGSEGLRTDQVRTYAEYRVFAALAPFGRHIRTASVHLGPGEDEEVTCAIDVDLGDAERIRCVGRESHVIGAIDRAADRARRVLERLAKQEVSS
jgi:hypothetical protein